MTKSMKLCRVIVDMILYVCCVIFVVLIWVMLITGDEQGGNPLLDIT